MKSVLVTPRSLTKTAHPAFSLFEKAGLSVKTCAPGVMPTEDDLLRLLPGCVGYLAGVEKISARVLEAAAAEGLEVISRNGVGIDNVDLEAAARLGIKVMPTKGANSRGVAELTMGLIFALLRSIPFVGFELKAERWTRREGMEVQGKKLGVIGCGEIGRIVSGMASALGMRVLGYDMYPIKSFRPENFSWAGLDDVIAEADVVTLHVPGGDRPLLDRETIGRMKRGVYIVNTARASVADEEAVLEGLESGRIAGFAVDAFDTEPPTDFRLVRHERVIATPHIGGYTKESVERVTVGAIQNIINTIKR